MYIPLSYRLNAYRYLRDTSCKRPCLASPFCKASQIFTSLSVTRIAIGGKPTTVNSKNKAVQCVFRRTRVESDRPIDVHTYYPIQCDRIEISI